MRYFVIIFNFAAVIPELAASTINEHCDEVLAAESKEVPAKAETVNANKTTSETTIKVAKIHIIGT